MCLGGNSQAADPAARLRSLTVTGCETVLGLPRSVEQAEILGCEQSLFLGEAPNVGVKLPNLSLELAHGCRKVRSRRRTLRRGFDLAQKCAVRRVERIAT